MADLLGTGDSSSRRISLLESQKAELGAQLAGLSGIKSLPQFAKLKLRMGELGTELKAAQAGQKRRKTLKARTSKTILTGGQGVTGPAPVTRRTLLGGS